MRWNDRGCLPSPLTHTEKGAILWNKSMPFARACARCTAPSSAPLDLVGISTFLGAVPSSFPRMPMRLRCTPLVTLPTFFAFLAA